MHLDKFLPQQNMNAKITSSFMSSIIFLDNKKFWTRNFNEILAVTVNESR